MVELFRKLSNNCMNGELNMNIELHLEGKDANKMTLLQIQDWTKHERVSGLHIQPKVEYPKEGEMGTGASEILSIVTTQGRAITEFVKSLYAWLLMRRPAIKIKLKTNDFEFELDATNLPAQQDIIDDVLALAKKSQGNE